MVTFCWLYLYRTFACSGLFLQWVISISYVKDLNISSITVSFTANRYICVYSIAYLGLQHIKQHIRLGWELIRFYQYQCHCRFSPSIPYQCSYRFLSSSLSGKKGALHSLLHQKQPFYFFPNLCLHKTVNMNIFNSNILTFNTWNMLNYSLTLIVFILISTLPLSAEVPVELDWPAATLAVVCRQSNTTFLVLNSMRSRQMFWHVAGICTLTRFYSIALIIHCRILIFTGEMQPGFRSPPPLHDAASSVKVWVITESLVQAGKWENR